MDVTIVVLVHTSVWKMSFITGARVLHIKIYPETDSFLKWYMALGMGIPNVSTNTSAND